MRQRRPAARRWLLGSLTTAALALTPLAAQAAPPEEPGPGAGTYLRLDSSGETFRLSPGDSVRWQVGVDLLDPPSPADIALRLTSSGPTTTLPGVLSLAMRWCAAPDHGCAEATTVLPPTPAGELTEAPLDLTGLSPGRLLVTATLPSDVPREAQGQELRLAVDARAGGADGPGEDVVTDPLPTTGATLLPPALLAAAAVLTGLGLAWVRRRAVRRPGRWAAR